MSFQAGLGRLLTYAHAGAVLAAAADLDIELRKAIESKMRPLNSDLKSRLFDGYGPLSTLSAKIDLAHALSITTPEIYRELRKIQNLRNKFAHPDAPDTIPTLENEPMKSIYEQLTFPEGEAGTKVHMFLA
jgi:hypothetical protein